MRQISGKYDLARFFNSSASTIPWTFMCFPFAQGENNCAAGGNPCCPNGFTAAPGFDPLSGLGSVNFGQLLKVLVAM
jgi:hypothetical protein